MDTQEEKVREAQRALLYQNASKMLGINLANAALVTAIMWEALAGPWLSIWLAAIVVTTLVRDLLVRGLGQARLGPHRRLRVYRLVMLALGLGWGMSLPLAATSGCLHHVFFAGLVVLGLTAGSLATSAAVPSVYWAYLVPVIAPGVVTGLVIGDALHVALAALLILYAAVMLLVADNLYNTLTRSLRLGFANTALVGTLTSANRELEQEITERRETEARLAESEAKFRTLTETIDCAIFVHRETFLYVNPAVTVMTGYDPQELLDMPFWQLIHPDHREEVRRHGLALLAGERIPGRFEFKVLTKYGETRWVAYTVGGITYEGRRAGLGAAFDVTEHKQARKALFREKERAQVTLASIADGVATADVDGRIEYLNPVAEALSGWSLEEARGRPTHEVLRLVDEAGRRPLGDPIRHCLDVRHDLRLSGHTLLLHRQEEKTFSVEVTVAPIRDRQRRIIGAVLVFHDVTELRGLTRQMQHQASHDALTGLINRREFEVRLEAAITSAQREGLQHVLCYLDLDQFKVVNDSCGHLAGDELLRRLAHNLREQLRESDLLARLGGDEFGVLFYRCPLEQARHLAERLRNRVHEFRFPWEGRVFGVGVSIGLVPITAASGALGDVLSAADAACYVAKDQGRNRVHVFATDDPELARRHGEVRWLQRLREALTQDRLRLYCQLILPVTDRTYQFRGEILLRMLDESGEIIGPGAFLPAAERYHLMGEIDRWVVRNTLRAIEEGRRPLAELELCAINLSGQSVGDEGFLDFIVAELERSTVAPNRICFEITETAVIGDLRRASRMIEVLREQGCRFALDDFGSGLSSFAYLRSLPVDYLKIDGLFIRHLADDPVDRAMVETMNHLGKVLGIATVAEFVRDERTLAVLRELGVGYAQGFALAEPVAVERRPE